MSNRLRTAILLVILVLWSLNFFAPLFGFQSSEAINGIFMGTIGALVASRREEEDEDRENNP